jgi:uncharacterized membrane protein
LTAAGFKAAARWLAAVFFAAAGLNHFRLPALYLSVMPPQLPWPGGLVIASGLAEIIGGLGILIPKARRLAAWGLIALLFAVLPANVEMALHGFLGLPAWALWLRLPFQLVFVAWIYWTCLTAPSFNKSPRLYRV